MSDGQQRTGLSAYNIFASHNDLDAAREAIGELELGGIDAEKISLVGPAPEAAEEETDTDLRDRDAPMVGHVAKRTAAGAAGGSAAGGAAGLLAGAAVFAIPGVGTVIGVGALAGALTGVFGGGAVGGFIGGGSALRHTEAWELTFATINDRSVLLVAHADSREEAERVHEAVSRTNPTRVDMFDSDGNHMPLGEASEG